jgi:hypothetical protein
MRLQILLLATTGLLSIAAPVDLPPSTWPYMGNFGLGVADSKVRTSKQRLAFNAGYRNANSGPLPESKAVTQVGRGKGVTTALLEAAAREVPKEVPVL